MGHGAGRTGDGADARGDRPVGRARRSVANAGFTTRADRAAFADWAREQGIPVRLHWLDLPPELRWSRVEARNRAGGEGTGFEVTRAMFDFVEGLWEAPDAAEMAALGGVRMGAEG